MLSLRKSLAQYVIFWCIGPFPNILDINHYFFHLSYSYRMSMKVSFFGLCFPSLMQQFWYFLFAEPTSIPTIVVWASSDLIIRSIHISFLFGFRLRNCRTVWWKQWRLSNWRSKNIIVLEWKPLDEWRNLRYYYSSTNVTILLVFLGSWSSTTIFPVRILHKSKTT